jgi:hypothetical protein
LRAIGVTFATGLDLKGKFYALKQNSNTAEYIRVGQFFSILCGSWGICRQRKTSQTD